MTTHGQVVKRHLYSLCFGECFVKTEPRGSLRIPQSLAESLKEMQYRLWTEKRVNISQGDLMEQAWASFVAGNPKTPTPSVPFSAALEAAIVDITRSLQVARLQIESALSALEAINGEADTNAKAELVAAAETLDAITQDSDAGRGPRASSASRKANR
jgi:hypothetical protein